LFTRWVSDGRRKIVRHPLIMRDSPQIQTA
jgi:hypothetical protein